jgi:hypothetical protein
MRDSGVIDQAVFSLYIDLQHDNSKISFGGYDLEKFAHKNSELAYHYVYPQNAIHWQLSLPQISVLSKDA